MKMYERGTCVDIVLHKVAYFVCNGEKDADLSAYCRGTMFRVSTGNNNDAFNLHI